MVAVASADSPVKGVATLLRAYAKLITERDAELILVSKLTPDGPTARLLADLALDDKVQFVSGISDDELAELLASAEVAVVPSLYEGFSLPAVEHMASGTPLVASRTGALPEVTGDAALLVTPGDVEELAAALRMLHDSRQSGTGFRPWRWPGCRSGSPGRRWPGPPSRQYRRAIDAATAARAPRAGTAVLTVDFSRLGIRPGTALLDLGCGPGGTRSRPPAEARTW